MEAIKFQREIRESCEELRTTLTDLQKWEKEVKDLEKNLSEAKNETLPPVRSSVLEKGTQGKVDIKQQSLPVAEKTKKVKVDENAQLKKRADEYKEKGNSYVKSGAYESAIHLYTDAINVLNTDPIYYTNRALCFLKLEKYDDCIQDCNRALGINPKTVKALYRRMQAYESMGENKKALEDCQRVLSIEPNNLETKMSLERIQKRIKEREKSVKENNHTINKQPTFVQMKSNMKVICPINKPAHLRSKKTLKRIVVEETFGDDKDSKNYENSTIASSPPISDEIIDKLFNSNEYANYKQVYKKQSPIYEKESKPPKEKLVPEPEKVMPLPAPPQTTGQFYATWKDLSKENKYLYLRSIEPSVINKILGASLDSDTLSDVISILSEAYIENELDVHKVLNELSNHDEIGILSLLLSSEDKSALAKLLSYMKERKDSEEDILAIKYKFNLL